jgi:hypothetical protein
MLYHVNPDTGVAGKCSAKKGGCPFGSIDEHFTSPEAARAAFEGSQTPFDLPKKRADLSESLPDWHGKLPSNVETKLAKKLNEDYELTKAVETGAIETKYANPEEFLTPPIYSLRSRGTWFLSNKSNDDQYSTEDLPDGEYVIAIHSRQGGGNRECFCEDYGDTGHEDGCLAGNNEELESHPQYVADYDDDSDYTYATHYFRGGFTKADVERHEEQNAVDIRARAARDRLTNLASGSVPPWSVLTDDQSPLRDYANAKQQITREATIAAEAKKTVAVADLGIEAFTKDRQLDDAEAAAVARALGRPYAYAGKSLKEEVDKLAEAKKARKAVEASIAQAQALPEGELKTYLLGDRGTGSYRTKEKQGRRNVEVTKTYSKGTLLGKELESAVTNEGYPQRALDRDRPQLEKIKADAQRSIESYEASVNSIEEKRRKAWATGWPGVIRDLPAIPEEF